MIGGSRTTRSASTKWTRTDRKVVLKGVERTVWRNASTGKVATKHQVKSKKDAGKVSWRYQLLN